MNRRIESGDVGWLLVAGAPRSGTTFLGRLIGSHPEVALFTEGGLDAIVVHLLAALTAPLGLVEPTSWPGMGRSLRRFAKAFYEARFGKADLKWIGDKQPVLPEHARRLGCAFVPPLAQIYIVRAPSDVIASSMVRAATPDDPWPVATVEEAVVEWVRHYEQAAALFGTADVLIVSYDRFKSAPAAVIDAIGAFLHLDPSLFTCDFAAKPDAPHSSAAGALLVSGILGDLERALLADFDACLRQRPLVHLPLPCRTMLPVNTANTLMQCCLKRGWDVLEEHGAWTVARQAELAFSVDALPGSRVTATLYLVCFGGQPGFELTLNGYVEDGGVDGARTVRLQPDAPVHEIAVLAAVAGDRSVSIVLTIERRKIAADEPVHDPRELGVLLQALRISYGPQGERRNDG